MNVPWKTIRVFISSTFKDMQAERDHLVRFVFPMLREDLLNYRIHLIDVDLRWGVTSDQDAFGVCREVIDECHPRFMGMLGGRYGWVPGGQNKSITADEIHYGVLERDAAKRGRAFFYFRDPKATAEIVEDDSDDFRETEGSDAAIKLTALKQTISDAKLPVFIYPAVWDVAQRRLTGLETFGNQVHADLLQSLKDDPDLAAHFTPEGTAQPDEFAEETEQMEAFIEERTQHYEVGSRQSLLNEMKAFAAADGTPNIFVLTGDPGSGKSALLAQFCRSLPTLPHANTPFLLLPHFVGASTGSTDLRRTLRRLCHELALAAGNPEPLPLDIKDLITHFQKLLAEAARRRRVILVFDALNQFDATDGAHWLNWLPRELPPGVRIVASVIAPAKGEKEHQTLAILRNRPDARVEKLEPMGRKDVGAIIEGYLKRYAKHLSRDQLALLLRKHDRRLPLYVLTALEELRTLGTYDEITDRIRTLPGDARALFGWILTERLARDPGFRNDDGKLCGPELVEKFAACLGVSRHGLSPAELTALLDPGDPLGNVAALLRLLRPYIMRRGELLDFYHGQFREAAETAYLKTPDNQPDPEKQRAAHESVATCLQAFADPHRDGQCRDATPHALSELPHHQTRAEAWPDLIASLENIFFLEAKVTHGMAFDLMGDFDAAVQQHHIEHAHHRILSVIQESLRRDIHFIARHAKDYPQGLFQCLYNSLFWCERWPAVITWRSVLARAFPIIGLHRKTQQLIERWRELYPSRLWLRAVSLIHRSGTRAGLRVSVPDGKPEIVILDPTGRYLHASTKSELFQWDGSSGKMLNRSTVQGQILCINNRASILATTHDQQTVNITAIPDLKVLSRLETNCQKISFCAFSPDETLIAVGSASESVELWQIYPPRCLWSVSKGSGSMEEVTCLAFNAKGSAIIAGLNGLGVIGWNLAGERIISPSQKLHPTYPKVTCVAPDESVVATGDYDGNVNIWSYRTGALLKKLTPNQGSISQMRFSGDSSSIFIASDAPYVTKINIVSGRGERRWECGSAGISDFQLNEEMDCLVAASKDGIVSISGFRRLRRASIDWNHDEPIGCLDWCRTKNIIATGGGDGRVKIWDDRTGELVRSLSHRIVIPGYPENPYKFTFASPHEIQDLWFSVDGRFLVVEQSLEGGVCHVWRTRDWKSMGRSTPDEVSRLIELNRADQNQAHDIIVAPQEHSDESIVIVKTNGSAQNLIIPMRLDHYAFNDGWIAGASLNKFFLFRIVHWGKRG